MPDKTGHCCFAGCDTLPCGCCRRNSFVLHSGKTCPLEVSFNEFDREYKEWPKKWTYTYT